MTYIVGEAQHDLGSAIPAGSNVLGHETLVRCAACIVVTTTRAVSASKAEVANLELTVRVDEEVTRLEIAMEDVGRMNVFKTAERLIDEGLEVSIGEGLLRANDRMKISFHKLFLREAKR